MDDRRYALFVGCTVPVRGLNYEMSSRRVAERIGLELVDIPEFSCCGFPLEIIDHHTATVVAVRNLALAEKEGLDILTLCNACTGHMTKAAKHFADEKYRDELERVNADLEELGHEYEGTVEVKHFARYLYEDIGLDNLKVEITDLLEGLRIAPHYGCHCIKPSDIFDGFDDPIHPESLDRLIETTGATSVQYKDKMLCCGGGILAFEEETPLRMVRKKLDNIKDAGADAMTLICPFCNIMYDEYQPTVESRFETEYGLPVLYYPQLLGLAMGLHPKKDLGINMNQVNVRPLLEKLEELGKSPDREVN